MDKQPVWETFSEDGTGVEYWPWEHANVQPPSDWPYIRPIGFPEDVQSMSPLQFYHAAIRILHDFSNCLGGKPTEVVKLMGSGGLQKEILNLPDLEVVKYAMKLCEHSILLFYRDPDSPRADAQCGYLYGLMREAITASERDAGTKSRINGVNRARENRKGKWEPPKEELLDLLREVSNLYPGKGKTDLLKAAAARIPRGIRTLEKRIGSLEIKDEEWRKK